MKKPVVEKEDKDIEDSVKAREQWIGFLKRNQSVLVELLYGQYKSTLDCPECNNISTCFDPFLSVSLPLVTRADRAELQSYFIFYDCNIVPIEINLSMSNDTNVMAYRHRIAKILNIHPMSFLIAKMDNIGYIEYLLATNQQIRSHTRSYHSSQKAFFLFQINPALFNSQSCSYFDNMHIERDYAGTFSEVNTRLDELKKIFNEEYEENDNGTVKEQECFYSNLEARYDRMSEGKKIVKKFCTDNNNGLSTDNIPLFLYLKSYDESAYHSKIRKRVLFPRIIHINKNWTCRQTHQAIFDYFLPIFKKSNPDEQDLWNFYFEDLKTYSDENIKRWHHDKQFPYVLRIRSILNTSRCIWCKKVDCDECLLPYSDDVTIQDLMNLIPKQDEREPDNTFYYTAEKDRRYYKLDEKDFSIEVTVINKWVEKFKELNNKQTISLENHQAGRMDDDINIHACFKNFVKSEKLAENSEWFCPKCKQHVRAMKKMEIYKSPHILIIHLKRFKDNQKINSLVTFPVEGLDISNYVLSNEDGLPLVYDLFAISNHFGGLGGGHYTAYGKNYHDQRWYTFNDSSVYPVGDESIVTSAGYVLFYRRRGLKDYVNLEELYKKPFENYEKTTTENISNLTIS
jgi:hypothetical protein